MQLDIYLMEFNLKINIILFRKNKKRLDFLKMKCSLRLEFAEFPFFGSFFHSEF